jgi:hypothetical protein
MMRKGMIQKDRARYESPAAIRPLGMTGKVPVTRCERMDAILKSKTMAGSPDADAMRSASRRLAHGFLFWSALSFVNP